MVKNIDWQEVFIRNTIISNRKELWRMRYGGYIKKLRRDYCNQCQRVKYCRRLYANEAIRRIMGRGDDCPDMFSIWETILDGTRHL